jgi:precorrin-6B methylase 2
MRGNDIKGWMSEEELRFLNDISKGLTVVELGSYLGRSTVALAEKAKKVYAVDHWNWTEGLGLVMDGTEYDQFLENTKDFSNIEVLKMSTLEASKKIDSCDIVFIDADHRYNSVKADIKAWFPKVNKIICGHDYDEQGVRRAVDESLNIDGIIGSIWYSWL